MRAIHLNGHNWYHGETGSSMFACLGLMKLLWSLSMSLTTLVNISMTFMNISTILLKFILQMAGEATGRF